MKKLADERLHPEHSGLRFFCFIDFPNRNLPFHFNLLVNPLYYKVNHVIRAQSFVIYFSPKGALQGMEKSRGMDLIIITSNLP